MLGKDEQLDGKLYCLSCYLLQMAKEALLIYSSSTETWKMKIQFRKKKKKGVYFLHIFFASLEATELSPLSIAECVLLAILNQN